MDDADSRMSLQVRRRHREQQKGREGPPTPQKVRTIHHYCPNTGTSIPLTDLIKNTLKKHVNTIRQHHVNTTGSSERHQKLFIWNFIFVAGCTH